MRGVGVERIFNQEDRQIRVTLVQGLAQALGGIAFAVILPGAIFIEDGLDIQRDDFLLLGMDDDSSQSRMGIREFAVAMFARSTTVSKNAIRRFQHKEFAVAMFARSTTGTVDFSRRKVFDAIGGNDDVRVAIFILAEDPSLRESLEEGSEKRAQ
ncbi:MAG TPA: hypothetical protein VIV66_02760, partial [Pyrinomonadaceae bacterium]